MDLFAVRTQVDRVSAGEWVGDIPGLGDIRLKVRGLNSTHFKDASAKAMRNLPRSERNRDGSLSSAVAERVTGGALAEAVLLDWENVTIQGDMIPYSKEKALELLTDPQWQIFRDAVEWSARIVADLRADDEGASLGK